MPESNETTATEMLSSVAQDYLKIMWTVQEWSGEKISTKLLAEKLGVSASTVSEAVRRLADQGLVDHERYGAISLTDEGRQAAVAMVRRHRLIETFLVRVLGYTWDEVHEDAEVLEHAVSDRFMARIDAHLGHPRRDPHGDPIPGAGGEVEELPGGYLTAVTEGEVVVEQVNDDDPELLRYLAGHRIVPGARIEVLGPPAAGILRVRVDGVEVVLAEASLGDIRVRR